MRYVYIYICIRIYIRAECTHIDIFEALAGGIVITSKAIFFLSFAAIATTADREKKRTADLAEKKNRVIRIRPLSSPPPALPSTPPLPAISRSLIARVEAPWKSASARGAIKIFKSKRARSLAGEAFLARSYPPRFSSSPVFPSHFPRHFPRGVRKVDFHFISKRILRDLA